MWVKRASLIGLRRVLRLFKPRPKSRRVVFHIGAHKTGTTSVQHLLERNRGRLALSLDYVPRRNQHLRAMSTLTAGPRSLDEAHDAARTLAALTAQLCRSYGDVTTLIISHEGLPGPMPGRPAQPGLYPFAGPLLQALVEGSTKAGFAPEFVFYTRDFADWQASLYRYRFRNQPDRAYAPKRFREIAGLPRTWDQQLMEFRKALGDVPLHELSFEDDRDRALMGLGLLQVLGLTDLEISRLRGVRPQNVTRATTQTR